MNAFGYTLLYGMLAGFVLLIIALTRPGRPSQSKELPVNQILPGGSASPQSNNSSGSGTWLLAWVGASCLTSMWYLSSTAGGGCDGGLCILRYILLPPIWLGVGVAVWIVKLVVQRAD